MYYDLLPKIKNAARAQKDRLTVPFSRMDFAVATALAGAGYVKSVEKETIGKKNFIVIRLVQSAKTNPVNDFKLMSKPSRHTYIDYRSLRAVKQGHGLGVLSTSKGVMTDKEARKQKIGGEYLFEIW
jgi:small subunit ribosomal protein S8